MILPRYGEACLTDVARWTREALGVERRGEWPEEIGEPPEVERVVLLVFDGLGAEQIERFSAHCPAIAALPGTAITSTFPSTTAAGLTSLSTGLPPGEHGIVGYVFNVGGGALNVVKFKVNGRDARTDIDPASIQPNATMFESADARGVTPWIVAEDGFRASGFTAVFLRGGRWRGWRKPDEIPAIVAEVAEVGQRTLVYAYYDGLDKAAHEAGIGSERYMAELAICDRIAGEIATSLAGGSLLLLTADHGMVPIAEEDRVWIGPEIDGMCRLIGGEGRCRYLYARDGASSDLFKAATEQWSEWAWVMSRDEAVAKGLYGPDCSDESARRIGDVVVAAREPKALFRRGRNKFIPKGNHGSLTAAEMYVPFRALEG